MNTLLFSALVSLSLAAGCGGGSSSGGGGAGGAGASGQTSNSSGSGSTTSSGSGSSSSGPVIHTPVCQASCQSPADCATPNVPAYDASHYTCNGTCQYTGCTSDMDCPMIPMKQSVCTKLNGATVSGCFQKCSAPADCAVPNLPPYDASHYACTNSACEYTGCKDDAECMVLLQKAAVCRKANGAMYPTCYPGCTTPADCAVPNVPAYDASHYTCDTGACTYTGCKSPMECTDLLMKPAICN